MTFAVLRALHAIIGAAIEDIERVYAGASDPDPSTPPLSTPDTPCSPYNTPLTPPVLSFGRPYESANDKHSTSSISSLSDAFPDAYDRASPPSTPRTPGKSAQPMIYLASPFPMSPMAYAMPSPGDLPPSTPPLDFPSLSAPYDPLSLSERLTTHPDVVAGINRIVAAAGQLSASVQAPFLSLCDASSGYHLPACLRFLEATHTVELLRAAGPSGLSIKVISRTIGVDPSKCSHILRLLATHHLLTETAPDVFAINRISAFMDTGKPWNVCAARPEKKYEDTNGISAFVGLCTDELFKSAAFLTEAFYLDRKTALSRDPTQTPFNLAFDTPTGFFNWIEEDGSDKPGAIPPILTDEGRIHARQYRLARFGKAMTGTSAWETPGAILNGLDWETLPAGSLIVDVGGGIGSSSMLLASAYPHLRFVIQDRPVVVEMGEKAWRGRCPELIDSGRAKFQVHDFFTPQPISDAAVFLLRVVLHDWPDAFAQRILRHLREVARPHTVLVIAEFILPLACVDDPLEGADEGSSGLEGIEGIERTLAPAPLLPNLGKANANAFWMDLTMQVVFNSQERTIREIVALAASAGWTVTKLTRAAGSPFGHILASPGPIPAASARRARVGSGSALLEVGRDSAREDDHVGASSRCGTPTFGSNVDLPTFGEAFQRFGGGILRGRRVKGANRVIGSGSGSGLLKAPFVINPLRKRSSPLVRSPSPPSSVQRTPPVSRQTTPAPPRQAPGTPRPTILKKPSMQFQFLQSPPASRSVSSLLPSAPIIRKPSLPFLKKKTPSVDFGSGVVPKKAFSKMKNEGTSSEGSEPTLTPPPVPRKPGSSPSSPSPISPVSPVSARSPGLRQRTKSMLGFGAGSGIKSLIGGGASVGASLRGIVAEAEEANTARSGVGWDVYAGEGDAETWAPAAGNTGGWE